VLPIRPVPSRASRARARVRTPARGASTNSNRCAAPVGSEPGTAGTPKRYGGGW
jgi:hypothetical protein